MFGEQEENKSVPLFRIHIPLDKERKHVNFEELYTMARNVFQKEISANNPSPKKTTEKEIEKTSQIDDPLKNKLQRDSNLSKFERTLLDIERRERELKSSIITSSLSKKKVKSVPSKGDAYESDDSFIDDTEYENMIVRHDGKDSFGDELMNIDEDDIESDVEKEDIDGSSSDSENEEIKITTTTEESTTFLPEMEKALEDLTLKAKEQNLGVLKKIPDIFEQNLVLIADIRQKLYPRGFPGALYKRIQTILSCPLQTLKNTMKKILEDNSLVDMKKQIKSKHDELKASVRDDILRALNKKLEAGAPTSLTLEDKEKPLVLPQSDVEKMDHSRLVEYARTQPHLKVTMSENTKDLFVKSVQFLLESLQKEKEFTGKEFDQEKELNNYFKEIHHFWPSKSLDLKKKYKSFTEPKPEKQKIEKEKKRKVDDANVEKRKKTKTDTSPISKLSQSPQTPQIPQIPQTTTPPVSFGTLKFSPPPQQFYQKMFTVPQMQNPTPTFLKITPPQQPQTLNTTPKKLQLQPATTTPQQKKSDITDLDLDQK